LIFNALKTEELGEAEDVIGKRTPIYRDKQYDPEAEFDEYVQMAEKYMLKKETEKEDARIRYNRRCARILGRRVDDIFFSLSSEQRAANKKALEDARVWIGEHDSFLNFVALWYFLNRMAGPTQTAYPLYTKITESRFPPNLLTAKMKSAYPSVGNVEDFWNKLKMKYTEERKKEVKELVTYLNKKQRSFHKI
jgi:hypothetical protein